MGRKKKTIEEPKGFGDTLKNIFDSTGVTKVVETVTNALGIEDCGCGARQELLNSILPYTNNVESKPNDDIKIVIVDNNQIAVFD